MIITAPIAACICTFMFCLTLGIMTFKRKVSVDIEKKINVDVDQ